MYPYDYGQNDYRNYLAHHGIKGQKWGDRNGPPYPLRPGAHSVAEKKHKTKGILGSMRESLARRHKAAEKKNEIKRKERLVKDLQKEERRREDYEQAKERAVKSGKASDVLRFQGDLTNQQLQEAVSRIRFENDLKKFSREEKPDVWSRMDRASSRLNTAGTLLNNIVTVGSNASKIKKSLDSAFGSDNSGKQATQSPSPNAKSEPKKSNADRMNSRISSLSNRSADDITSPYRDVWGSVPSHRRAPSTRTKILNARINNLR